MSNIDVEWVDYCDTEDDVLDDAENPWDWDEPSDPASLVAPAVKDVVKPNAEPAVNHPAPTHAGNRPDAVSTPAPPLDMLPAHVCAVKEPVDPTQIVSAYDSNLVLMVDLDAPLLTPVYDHLLGRMVYKEEPVDPTQIVSAYDSNLGCLVTTPQKKRVSYAYSNARKRISVIERKPISLCDGVSPRRQ